MYIILIISLKDAEGSIFYYAENSISYKICLTNVRSVYTLRLTFEDFLSLSLAPQMSKQFIAQPELVQ